MTIFWRQTGALIAYSDGALRVENLNPHVETSWRMSRLERLRAGFWLMLSAVKS